VQEYGVCGELLILFYLVVYKLFKCPDFVFQINRAITGNHFNADSRVFRDNIVVFFKHGFAKASCKIAETGTKKIVWLFPRNGN
jgi:hypothetical protein